MVELDGINISVVPAANLTGKWILVTGPASVSSANLPSSSKLYNVLSRV